MSYSSKVAPTGATLIFQLTTIRDKNLVLSTELIMKIGHRTEILKADVSSVSPSSERIGFALTKG